MRFISADYVFPISSPPVKNGVVEVGVDGSIMNVFDPGHAPINTLPSTLETFKGIICPGFINTHCHLELSHLKGKLTPGKGLPHFIREIAASRKATDGEIKTAIANAEEEMIAAGIVAVGDISNFNHSFEQKKKGLLKYHTFIEIFDLVPERAEGEFERGLILMNELNAGIDSKSTQSVSITPHAPYTITSKLLKLIYEYSLLHHSLLSIHNQETKSENEMFLRKKGDLFDTLSSFGNYYDNWKATGTNSLESIMMHLPKTNKTQLVHNTYTTKGDIARAENDNHHLWWCTCPNANLFIENKLPDYKLFLDADCRMTIGTDSYASNWSLSILDELKTITKHAPFVPLKKMLTWATLSGAEFLGFETELGSIEKGKKSGLNLIGNVDFEKMNLTADSTVVKII